MTALVISGALCSVFGYCIGWLFAVRNAHRILARLQPAERLEFARKVNATIRRL